MTQRRRERPGRFLNAKTTATTHELLLTPAVVDLSIASQTRHCCVLGRISLCVACFSVGRGSDVPQVGTESNPVEIDIDTDDTSAGGQDKRKKKAVPKKKASREGKRKAAPAGGRDREASGKRPARRAGGGNVGIAVRAVRIVAWIVETILVLSWRPPAANTPRRLRTCSILPPEEKCIRTLSLILTPSDPATRKEVHTNPNPNILTP